MNIVIKTIHETKIQLNNIREMSETNDGMIIFVPRCDTVPISIDGKIVMYSETPSIDNRIISSLEIAFRASQNVNN